MSKNQQVHTNLKKNYSTKTGVDQFDSRVKSKSQYSLTQHRDKESGEETIGIGRFESFPTQVRKYVVSLLGATESTKSARQAALNEHTSFRVIHASAGCPRASIRNTRGCVCVSDGNDDLAADVSTLSWKVSVRPRE